MIKINFKKISCFLAILFLIQSVYAESPNIKAASKSSSTQTLKLPVIELSIGFHAIQAEVAADEKSREQGLMYRKRLERNQGMLFIFESKNLACFWMKNTLLPLSIAFIADDGTIIDIQDMAPNTTQPHCPNEPVKYALEMNQNWFYYRNIRPGEKLIGLPH